MKRLLGVVLVVAISLHCDTDFDAPRFCNPSDKKQIYVCACGDEPPTSQCKTGRQFCGLGFTTSECDCTLDAGCGQDTASHEAAR